MIYLDRGDGVFVQEGETLEESETSGAPDVVSDRPRRTGPKSRIMLERATFAGGERQR